MIQLTWGQIRDQKFVTSLRKFSAQPLPFKVSYHLGRIASKVDSELALAQGEFHKIVTKCADVSEEGNYKVKEEMKDTWKEEMTDFIHHTFAIDKHKINVALIPDSVILAAEDILALEPILYGLEGLEGGLNEKSNEENLEESSQEDCEKIKD